MAAGKYKQRITVQITRKFESINVSLPRLKRLAKAVCAHFKISKATVGITITDDTEIRRLNRRFLNHSRTTDCLSFNLSDDEDAVKSFDLVVNGELALREAKRRGHPAEAELALYITHGLLHNLGFDDSTRKQAQKMHNTEDKILRQFGYGPVYSKMYQNPKSIINRQ